MKYLAMLLVVSCCANKSVNTFGEVPKYFYSEQRQYKYEVLSCTENECIVKVIEGIKSEAIGEVFSMSKSIIYGAPKE